MILFSSKQQRLVAEGLLSGLKTKEIAHELKISESMVKKHLINMYRFIGIDRTLLLSQIVLAVFLHEERPDLCCTCNPSLTRWIKASEQSKKINCGPRYVRSNTVRQWTSAHETRQLSTNATMCSTMHMEKECTSETTVLDVSCKERGD